MVQALPSISDLVDQSNVLSLASQPYRARGWFEVFVFKMLHEMKTNLNEENFKALEKLTGMMEVYLLADSQFEKKYEVKVCYRSNRVTLL